NTEFRSMILSEFPEQDVTFEQLSDPAPDRNYIGKFFESVQIKTINSFTGAVLDYDKEPGLKSIGIGGNKLSRGLTLEGLMTSYFIRKSPTYDTLMQMGRWFGFRKGYVDLTRIWTTRELADRFALLAFVEHRLREDIRVYEDMQITPVELGMRIWQHPSMQVTSYLKSRFARTVYISQSYSGQLEQTFKFQFDNPSSLAEDQDANAILVERFLKEAGKPSWQDNRPIWTDVKGTQVLKFLIEFRQDNSPERAGCSLQLISNYIENQMNVGELTDWTVSVRGRENENEELGAAKWKVDGRSIWQVSRTKIRNTFSLGVITSPGDEAIGLSREVIQKSHEILGNYPDIGESRALRMARSPQHGILLIYPISKNSIPEDRFKGNREPIFDNPSDQYARDIIAIAISFPESKQPQPVQAYLEGSVGWRTYDGQP
ncbi:MAG: Z1 domain-containing protein, partial [Thermoplasmatales archaeon]